MGWKRLITNGILGDKKKVWGYQDSIRCPYGESCPSHMPFKNAYPPKIKFVERLSPYVYTYQCQYCGCKFNYDASDPEKFHHSELPFMQNKNFLFRKG